MMVARKKGKSKVSAKEALALINPVCAETCTTPTTKLSAKEALALIKAFNGDNAKKIREKVGPGKTRLNFSVRVKGNLIVGPDQEYQNWAAICPWTVLLCLAEDLEQRRGCSIIKHLLEKAMQASLERRDSPVGAGVDELKRMAERVCKGAGKQVLKTRKGVVLFEGSVEKEVQKRRASP